MRFHLTRECTLHFARVGYATRAALDHTLFCYSLTLLFALVLFLSSADGVVHLATSELAIKLVLPTARVAAQRHVHRIVFRLCFLFNGMSNNVRDNFGFFLQSTVEVSGAVAYRFAAAAVMPAEAAAATERAHSVATWEFIKET